LVACSLGCLLDQAHVRELLSETVNSVPEALLKPLQRLAVNDDNKRVVGDVCMDLLLNILDPKVF